MQRNFTTKNTKLHIVYNDSVLFFVIFVATVLFPVCRFRQ
jgi:hypothetical protein